MAEKKEINDRKNRLNTLYVLLTLKNHSSEKHPLSISEITKLVNRDYCQAISETETAINVATITRILDALMDEPRLGFQSSSMVYFTDPSNIGFNIYCLIKDKDGEWETYSEIKNEKCKGRGKTKYYYYESVFSDAELITLIDSVETYNYFSTDDIAGLISKLLKLRPKSELLSAYHEEDGKQIKQEDSLVFFNIDSFSEIIKANHFAKITYCNYDYKHELAPREGYPRIIRPLSMMWSNGYYYLVALLKPGYTPANLRMDRIINIEDIEPTPKMLNEFQVDMNLDVSAYRMKHPVMHGGKVQHICMLYLDSPKNGMSNAMMDTFGKITKVRPATAEELEKHLPAAAIPRASEGIWMRADFQATTAGTELFATQYCRYCKVISPTSLAEEITDNLKTGLRLY